MSETHREKEAHESERSRPELFDDFDSLLLSLCSGTFLVVNCRLPHVSYVGVDRQETRRRHLFSAQEIKECVIISMTRNQKCCSEERKGKWRID
jgi:hypothetical protein